MNKYLIDGIQNPKHQLLFNNLHYNFSSGIEYKNSFKSSFLSNEYSNATGLKIKAGSVTNGLFLICIDIDCKEDSRTSYLILLELLKTFSFLRNTYIEKTKSGGYHLFFYTDFKTSKNKLIFINPFYEKLKLINIKAEIEIFFNGDLIIAPSKTKLGNYEVVNPVKPLFIDKNLLKYILKQISLISEKFEFKTAPSKSKNYQNNCSLYNLEPMIKKQVINILEKYAVSYKIEGSKVWVYKHEEQKKPDLLINYQNKKFYLWNKKNQHAPRKTLDEFVNEKLNKGISLYNF